MLFRSKLSLGQNPSFTRYYELMVTDPEEKAKNLEMYIYRDGTIPVGAVKMKSLSLFTWVGNFEFDTKIGRASCRERV